MKYENKNRQNNPTKQNKKCNLKNKQKAVFKKLREVKSKREEDKNKFQMLMLRLL